MEKNLIPPREDFLISRSILASGNEEKKRDLKNTLEDSVHWDAFSERKISLSAYYHLKKLSLDKHIPTAISRKLENRFLSNTAFNILHLENLAQLAQKLKDKKIPVIILKGAALCETVYPHVGMRLFCDLDILIQRKHIQEAKGLLEQLGYALSFTHARHHFMAFQTSPHSLPLEVHWNLVNDASPFQKYAFKLSMDRIWQDARPFSFRGVEALGLSPEHRLIYLSIHMLKEGYSQQKWLLDIYYLLKSLRGQIDWPKLLVECREFHARRPVYYALSALDELFQITERKEWLLNRKVLDQLKPRRISSLERSILNRLMKNKPLNSPYHRFFLYVFSIERFTDKLKALLSFLKYSIQLPSIKFKEKA